MGFVEKNSASIAREVVRAIQKASDSSEEELIVIVERKLEGLGFTVDAERFITREYFDDFYKWLDEKPTLRKYMRILPFKIMRQIMAWELVSVWRMEREREGLKDGEIGISI